MIALLLWEMWIEGWRFEIPHYPVEENPALYATRNGKQEAAVFSNTNESLLEAVKALRELTRDHGEASHA